MFLRLNATFLKIGVAFRNKFEKRIKKIYKEKYLVAYLP